MSNLALRYLGNSPRLYTGVGSQRGDTIVLENCAAGCGLYGPYVNLPRGQYHAFVRFAPHGRQQGRGLIDVCRGMDAQIITSARFDLAKTNGSHEIGINFRLAAETSQCQVRLQCAAGVSATIESLEIEFRDVDSASIETTVRDGIGDRTVSPPFVRLSRIRRLKRFIDHPIADARLRVEKIRTGELPEQVEAILTRELPKQIGVMFYQPNDIVAGTAAGEYMAASNPLARDFLHPEYQKFCRIYHEQMTLHRKQWEFAFIYERLRKAGVLCPGTRGLGFGVGTEKLPSFFASLGIHITATDAAPGQNWAGSSDVSDHKSRLFQPDMIDLESFDNRVSFEYCDMNDIPSHLTDYDFCWSSCSFEHLGNLQRGIDFVINSVEQSLKVGGVACHTTELNLSSDDKTIETGGTVIYRKKDLERLCRTLIERGHWVEPLRIEPGTLPPDYFVDVPPHSHNPHLKLLLGSYVATSVGLVVRRGR